MMADEICPSKRKFTGSRSKSRPFLRPFDMIKAFQWLMVLIFIVSTLIVSIESSEIKCGKCDQGSCVKRPNSCVCYPGWRGALCNECYGRFSLTPGKEGVISDGSGNYSQDMTCSWLLDAGEKGLYLTIKINSFATECIWDHIYIHNGDSAFAPLMAAHSGFLWGHKENPHLRFKLNGRYAFIHFYSDAAFTLPGFNISYKVDNCSLGCSGNAICNNSICQCSPGWKGDDCDAAETVITGCPNNCSGDGECVEDASGGYYCTSKKGFLQVEKMPSPSYPSGRASLALVAENSTSLWIMGGYRMGLNPKSNNLFRFDVGRQAWDSPLEKGNSNPWPRYGHSGVSYNNDLYLFGGVHYIDIKNDFWVYSTAEQKWEELTFAPRNLSGHTAHVFRDVMIVIFGFSPDFGYSSDVLEYNFDTKKWLVIETRGSRVEGGYGHTSVYDENRKKIYVYGGHHNFGASYKLTNKLYEYDPVQKAWFILRGSEKARYLHAAVMMNGLMFIYGGNTHNDTRMGNQSQCFASDFIVYDRSCNRWHRVPSPVTNTRKIDLDRFGHAMITVENVAYMFGGFNAIIKNDLLKISAGHCSFHEKREACQSSFPGLKCQWSGSSCTAVEAKDYTCADRDAAETLCEGYNTCSVCHNNTSCRWCSRKCFHKSTDAGTNCSQGAADCSQAGYDECSEIHSCRTCEKSDKCIWQVDVCKSLKSVKTGMEKQTCERSVCKYKDSCSACTQATCMWCSRLNQCIDTNAYVVYYFYGQCMDWTTKEPLCEVNTCASQQTCADCQAHSQCGWCDDDSGTGAGFCHEGGMEGPLVLKNGSYVRHEQTCPAGRWYFDQCPLCQCNGHSQCVNGTDKCEACQSHTVGKQCQSCVNGYFGNALNGGNCSVCFCNGQADTCHPETGHCYCKTKGVIGPNCGKCESNYRYSTESNSGEICYYPLVTDYQYTFNMSQKEDRNYSQINFFNTPTSSDQDLDFTLNCSSLAFMNITYRSKSFPEEKEYVTGEVCDYFRHRFEHKDFAFGGKENITFLIYVYDFKLPLKLQISFVQQDKLNLVKFFVIFFSCFLSLLLIAAAFWKIKHKYESYRRRQQHNLEMEEMASRPFSTIAVEIERKSQPTVLDKRDHLDSVLRRRKRVANKPSAVAIEPLVDNKAAILTLIIQLPTGNADFAPSSQSGLAIGSALVSIGSHRKQSLDHAKEKPKIRKHLNVHLDPCA